MGLAQELLEAEKPRFNTTMKALRSLHIDIIDFVNDPGETIGNAAQQTSNAKGYGHDGMCSVVDYMLENLFGEENAGEIDAIGLYDLTQDMVSIDGVPLVEFEKNPGHRDEVRKRLEKEKKKLIAKLREIDDQLGNVELG